MNPFSGKLVLVVEPRLTSAKRWYLSADPASVDGLEFAYLEGSEASKSKHAPALRPTGAGESPSGFRRRIHRLALVVLQPG